MWQKKPRTKVEKVICPFCHANLKTKVHYSFYYKVDVPYIYSYFFCKECKKLSDKEKVDIDRLR